MADSGSYETSGDAVVNDKNKKAFILVGERNILRQHENHLIKERKRIQGQLDRTVRRIKAISREIQELMYEGDMGNG